MKEKPLLSIVVPTKDRYYYLKQLIQLIKSFNSDEIELVVQDNTKDNAEILEFIGSLNYEGLKYFHTELPISVSDNSTKAILNSTGEYVCFIGDDDGVTRFIVEAVKWMKDNNVSILKSSITVYKWPSFISSKYYNVSSSAIFNEYKMTYKKVDTKDALRRLLKSGIDTLAYMPKTYNGITKRSVLDKIFDKCATFYPGPSPDMANAVSLALEEDSFAIVDAPIIIGGHSANLGGNVARYKHRYGPLEEQPFIDKSYINNWSQKIPKIWSAHTVWPESAITALKAYEAEELLNIIDYDFIYKIFIVHNPTISNMAYSLCEKKIRLKIKVFLYYLYRGYRGVMNVLEYKFFNKYDGMKIHRNITDIISAEAIIVSGLKEFKLKKI